MDNLVIESGTASVNKHDESLCGDFYDVYREQGGLTAVLSDGLGSGVKANILSTLTVNILSTLIRHNLTVQECVETVASTLPVCKERRLAYSTFTVAQVRDGQARLLQYDNPHAILLRNGKNVDYPYSVHFIGTKEIHESKIFLQENDVLVLMSDGVTNAGIGKLMADGWPREDIIRNLEQWYTPDLSARRLTAQLVNACVALCEDSPDDDITALALKLRSRKAVNVMIGAPANADEDDRILRLFFKKEGKHVVCGGTTAKIVGRYLRKPVLPVPESGTDEVPTIASIEGVDLATEGVITLRLLEALARRYLEDARVSLEIQGKKDGVSLLAELLFEHATDISIFFGQAINQGNDDAAIDMVAKHTLMEKLTKSLTEMGKNVKISLC
ncbi:MAG TPA: SpoIIE family protein phosphatase [Candidatus Aphodomonas merdavium]|nr:SpoIIE family protein phosphatase [Candidatus Aphodomonas merdavium]